MSTITKADTQYQLFGHNFEINMGTVEVSLPWANRSESNADPVTTESPWFMAPCNMQLVKFALRYEQNNVSHDLELRIRIVGDGDDQGTHTLIGGPTIIRCFAGQVYNTQYWTYDEMYSSTGPDTPTMVHAGELIKLSIKADTDPYSGTFANFASSLWRMYLND